MSRTCEYGQWLLKVGGIVQIWNRKLKKYCKKMIKIITKASKVSKRNMNKGLNIVKKFMKMLSIMLTDREKRI